jgi:hypothetical protein
MSDSAIYNIGQHNWSAINSIARGDITRNKSIETMRANINGWNGCTGAFVTFKIGNSFSSDYVLSDNDLADFDNFTAT